MVDVMAVIPARYASTRFPGKPLALIAGKPMIRHVWEQCTRSRAFARVVVATDDPRIAQAARAFGAEVALTSPHCATGTDRVAEVARKHPAVALFVNVQGDEPLVAPQALRVLVKTLRRPGVEMATLIRPLEPQELDTPHVVKVVVTRSKQALYFSRAPIPHDRAGRGPTRYAHLGLYGYRRDTLLALARLKPTPLEQAESLEQLRALENGIRIQCELTQYASIGVDTPDDLRRVEALFQASGRRPSRRD